jgi:hypothetical protein
VPHSPSLAMLAPETAYYVFHRRAEVVPARPCALVRRRLGGLLPAPVLASESPGERGKQLSILDQGEGWRGAPNRCRRAAGSQGFGPAPGCEQGMPPGRADLASQPAVLGHARRHPGRLRRFVHPRQVAPLVHGVFSHLCLRAPSDAALCCGNLHRAFCSFLLGFCSKY